MRADISGVQEVPGQGLAGTHTQVRERPLSLKVEYRYMEFYTCEV